MKVIDIGGFIGETTLFLISKGAMEVIVYEPVIVQKGIGDRDCEIDVAYEEFGADFGRTSGSKIIKIELLKLDDVIKEGCDLIKFNCEGCEKAIIFSNPEYVRKIPNWIIQTHRSGLEIKIKNFMLALGFRLDVEYRHNTKTPIYTLKFSKSI